MMSQNRLGTLLVSLTAAFATGAAFAAGPQAPQQGNQAPQQGPQAPQQGPQAPQQGPRAPQQGPQAPQQGPQAPQQGPQAPQQGNQAPQQGNNQASQAPQQGNQAPQQGPQAPQQGPQAPQQGPQAPQQGPQAPQQGPQAPQQGPQAPQQGNQAGKPPQQGPQAPGRPSIQLDQLPSYIVLDVPFDASGAQQPFVASIKASTLPIPVDYYGNIDADQVLSDVLTSSPQIASFSLSSYAGTDDTLPDIVRLIFNDASQTAGSYGSSLAWRLWQPVGNAGLYGFSDSQTWGPISINGDIDAPTIGYYRDGAAYPFTYSFYRVSGNHYYFFYFD